MERDIYKKEFATRDDYCEHYYVQVIKELDEIKNSSENEIRLRLSEAINHVKDYNDEDIFETFKDFRDSVINKIEANSFKSFLLNTISYIVANGENALFEGRSLLSIAVIIRKYERLLKLLEISNVAIAKQNRAKRKPKPEDPNINSARILAKEIWGNTAKNRYLILRMK
ncbi:hypothetical protein [Pasteurella multocida]|uniref:hypothetical protein n=1 Tax=Pasteurella multocida TaxID=747 RepID=UPI001F08695F|nr:hypothetical protein [Pasteurella multocida]